MCSTGKVTVDFSRRNYNYSIRYNRWFLKPIGAWPEWPTSSATERTVSKIIRLICHTLIVFTVIPAILYILFEEKDINLKLKVIGPTSHWVMGGVNYFSLLNQKKEIRKCIDHIEMDWRMANRKRDQKVMLKNAKAGCGIAAFCAIIMQGSVLLFNLARGTSPMIVVIDNETVAMGQLPCPSYNKIWDTRFSPVYELVFAMQILSTIVVNNTTISACALAAVFAMHACGQLSVVMSRLEELDGEEDFQVVQKKLANLVEQHLRVLKFLTRMEIIIRQVCFVELVGCTFNLCMIGFYTITQWHVETTNTMAAYFTVFVSMMFNIFIFCYIGDLVTEQCKKVGEAAYMTNWYQLPRETVLDLILIILRSSIVIKITAGKLFHMSIPTFGDVIKTSMAYLNMLRTLTI